jgi:hypothetical protein
MHCMLSCMQLLYLHAPRPPEPPPETPPRHRSAHMIAALISPYIAHVCSLQVYKGAGWVQAAHTHNPHPYLCACRCDVCDLLHPCKHPVTAPPSPRGSTTNWEILRDCEGKGLGMIGRRNSCTCGNHPHPHNTCWVLSSSARTLRSAPTHPHRPTQAPCGEP